ncbi:MAG: hypothetical protein ABIZ56_01275, partial [Chthoniobacteraceae bacterium]
MNPDSATTLGLPPPETPVCASRFGPREFFDEFFRRVDERGIPYAVLHGYNDFPARFGSDVDYAVPDADRPKIAPLLAGLARERGWIVAKTWQHEL